MMRMNPELVVIVLGMADICASLLMLWSFYKITTPAGFMTPQARWALFRRFVYACATISLFGLGVERLMGDYPAPNFLESVFQMMLLFVIMIFPLLRAFGFISQDSLLLDGRGTPRQKQSSWASQR